MTLKETILYEIETADEQLLEERNPDRHPRRL
jgi:hypothetical protein